MKLNSNKRNTTVNLTLTGLMGALVFLATMFFKVQIVAGTDKTMIGFENVFCILSGLLLGPVYGGLASGIGSFLFDLVSGWASSAPVTLITKFLMAFICGVIAYGGDHKAKKLVRIIAAAVVGSLSYCVLYLGYSYAKLIFLGSTGEAANVVILTKLTATLTNAVIADTIGVPLYFAVRAALERSHLEKGI